MQFFAWQKTKCTSTKQTIKYFFLFSFCMLISFFEEFPTTENMRKLKYLSFPTKIYLAAHSLSEFEQIKQSYQKKHYKNIIEWIYWPILDKKEGYWLSPFSNRKALQRIFQEVQHHTNPPSRSSTPLMLDLELPTRHNPLLYLTQSWYFLLNKHLITNFIKNYKGKIYLAEYYPENAIQEHILQILGLHYPSPNASIIKMIYHSLHPFTKKFVRTQLQRGKTAWGPRFLIGLGTIAKGINGTEKILSLAQLQNDLNLAKQEGISEVIIFRLGGLNKKYVKVLEKFT